MYRDRMNIENERRQDKREKEIQKKYYVPIRKVTNEEHKIRKEAVKQRVKRCRRTDERRAQDT